MTARQRRDVVLSCECSYRIGPTTPGIARFSFDRHSCQRWREVDARGERALRQWDHVDRTPKPCLHPRAKHQHGQRVTYTSDGCRCLPCCHAQLQYETKRKRDALYGRGNLIEAEAVRDRLRELSAAGVGTRRVAKLAGLSRTTVMHITIGLRGREPARRVERRVAEAIFAVPFEHAPHAVLDGVGTSRRLRALVAMGWPQARLAAELGITQTTMSMLIGERRRVHAVTAAAARELYDRLWQTEPPRSSASTYARRRAAALGWATPLAWDEDAIDNPDAMPDLGTLDRVGVDEAAVERRMAGDRSVVLTNAERREVVRRLHATGISDRAIERRTGIDERQVLRDRRRQGLAANDESRRASA